MEECGLERESITIIIYNNKAMCVDCVTEKRGVKRDSVRKGQRCLGDVDSVDILCTEVG